MPRRKLRLKLKSPPPSKGGTGEKTPEAHSIGNSTTSSASTTPASTPQRRRARSSSTPKKSSPLKELETTLTCTTWTFPGWQDDVQEFHSLLANCTSSSSSSTTTMTQWVLTSRLHGMQHKQQAFLGDRSHAYLQRLDALLPHLNYHGWPQDYQAALQAHYGHDNEWNRTKGMWKLQQKQCVLGNRKDRSHPRLVELDSLELTYPGHSRDAQHCLELHFDYADDYIGNNVVAKELQSLQHRQAHWEGKTTKSLQELQAIQSTLSYEGWQDDIQAAREAHLHSYSTLPSNGQVLDYATALQHVQHKHSLVQGDRSHPRLVALDRVLEEQQRPDDMDSLHIWQQLVQECENTHLRYPTEDWIGNAIFEQLLKALRYLLARQNEKQRIPSTPSKKKASEQASSPSYSTITAITASSSWSSSDGEEDDGEQDVEETTI